MSSISDSFQRSITTVGLAPTLVGKLDMLHHLFVYFSAGRTAAVYIFQSKKHTIIYTAVVYGVLGRAGMLSQGGDCMRECVHTCVHAFVFECVRPCVRACAGILAPRWPIWIDRLNVDRDSANQGTNSSVAIRRTPALYIICARNNAKAG